MDVGQADQVSAIYSKTVQGSGEHLPMKAPIGSRAFPFSTISMATGQYCRMAANPLLARQNRIRCKLRRSKMHSRQERLQITPTGSSMTLDAAVRVYLSPEKTKTSR